MTEASMHGSNSLVVDVDATSRCLQSGASKS